MSPLFNIIFFLLTSDAVFIAAQNTTNYNYAIWINELPNYKVDLKEYKDALINILFFFKDYRNKIDVNVAFGLRLIIENFKHSLAYVDTKLLLLDKVYINNVIQRTENLFRSFKMTLPKLHSIDKNIAAVTTATEQPWTDRMKKYDMDLFKLKVERPMSLNWERYKLIIREVNKTVPSPMLSDFCVDRLADESVFDSAFPQECEMVPDCMDSLINGTDFGYALAHRILMLVFANIGRNCHILSWEEDSKLIEKLCQIGLRECEYIVDNEYVEPDLLIEFITVCTMQGYTQFLRRTWFQHFLQLQTAHGCFMASFEQPIDFASRNMERKYVRGNQEQVKKCNMHITAVATAALAAAIRFILESYY